VPNLFLPRVANSHGRRAAPPAGAQMAVRRLAEELCGELDDTFRAQVWPLMTGEQTAAAVGPMLEQYAAWRGGALAAVLAKLAAFARRCPRLAPRADARVRDRLSQIEWLATHWAERGRAG
jgi:hypothetical protein